MSGTAIATRPSADTGLATIDPHRAAMFDGITSEDFALPVLHLFQDIGNESDVYGEHDKGQWINSITQQPVENVIVVPVKFLKEAVVWHSRDSKNGQGIVERFPNRNAVPAEFLENETDYDVVDTITMFAILDGETLPVVVRFKSTSLRTVKQILTAEAARAQAGKPRGVYQLSAREAKNDKGKWMAPTQTPKGNATPEQEKQASESLSLVTSANVRIADPEEVNDGIPV